MGKVTQYLWELSKLARNSESEIGEFKETDYKWRLGAHVVSDLQHSHSVVISESTNDTKPTLFGIEIEIDYHNPENVQLWKNITNNLRGVIK